MQKINLRLASNKDKEFLRNIRNRNKEFFFKKDYITKSQHEKWFKKQLASNKDFIFIIELFEDKKKLRIGTISSVNADFKQKKTEFGRFIITEKFRYLGFGKLVVKKFREICKNVGISKISLYLRKDNSLALDFYLRLGFKIFKKTKEKIYMRNNL